MNIVIKGKPNLDIKRMYLPLEIDMECPYCGNKYRHDFEEQYLSYPNINEEEDNEVECEECENTYSFGTTLIISMDISLPKKED